MFWLIILHLGVAASKPMIQAEDTAMLQVMDSLEQLMTGGLQYDREFYDSLRNCMGTFDSRLIQSQDDAWQGIIDFWNSNGTVTDRWGASETPFMEYNDTASNLNGMIIYEPCNYASNMVYYHDATEICAKRDFGAPWSLSAEYVNALGKAFSGLAMGSSFMHMSNTRVGAVLDNLSIGVVSYLVQQASLSALPDASPILTDLQETKRPLTALEIADEFMNMYTNLSVYEWAEHAESIDMPNYYLTFGGIFGTALTLGFSDELVDKWVPILGDIFQLPQEFIDFLTIQYLPEIRNQTANVDLGPIEHAKYLKDGIGTALKLIYAFLWQEQFFTDSFPGLMNETVNVRGWELLPVINTKINNINSYEYFEVDLQNGTDIYPGDIWCNPVQPHAKWHLQSGIGLLDLVYLGDEIFNILSNAR